MRNLAVYIIFFSISSTLLAQNTVVRDTVSSVPKPEIIIPEDIDSRNLIEELNGIKELDGGFLLDLNLLPSFSPRLTYPLEGIHASNVYAIKDYNRLLGLTPSAIYGKTSSEHLFHNTPLYGRYGYSGIGWYTTPTMLQSATFKLNNGARLTTYGEYNADGYKMYNGNALPWQRNNFRGAFEFKSSNGNFGIRVEVHRGRETPFGY